MSHQGLKNIAWRRHCQEIQLEVPVFGLSYQCVKTQLVLIGSPPSLTDWVLSIREVSFKMWHTLGMWQRLHCLLIKAQRLQLRTYFSIIIHEENSRSCCGMLFYISCSIISTFYSALFPFSFNQYVSRVLSGKANILLATVTGRALRNKSSSQTVVAVCLARAA